MKSFWGGVDGRTYLCDDNRVKELPPRPDQVDQLEENQHVMEQRSHYEEMDDRKDTGSTSTRMQQQRDQHNSNTSGQVDISDGSTSRHSYKSADRRDSWLLRIDSSAKNIIRRASASKHIQEQNLINSVADSINNYGDHHQDDSWTDKVLDFLFPSMELRPHPAQSSPTATEPTPPLMPLSDDIAEKLKHDEQEDREAWSQQNARQSKDNEDPKSCTNETSDTMDVIDQTAISSKSRSSA
ncbi:hypothetical protein [Absidia glauca]|uniref:Uncharacterized protein n=1 Tax=Absidia glauca TaxID=4829 RepID=A0A163L0Z6_ABSGL|nr:hypothetical protein [Absidia glauca]